MTRSQRRFMQKARQRRAGRCPGKSSQAKGVRIGRNGKLVINRTELRRTSYHEAGHAVMCSLLGIRYEFVSIVPYKGLLGRVSMKRSPIWRAPNARVPRRRIERQILNCFAGGIAERMARRDGLASGLGRLEHGRGVNETLPRMPHERLAVRYTKRVLARAEVLVRRHWSEICDVAEMLRNVSTTLIHRGSAFRLDSVTAASGLWVMPCLSASAWATLPFGRSRVG